VNDMRAVVIEIHKHYCIAVTPDGRFVKQSIEQGELEIGDEIMIEAGHVVPGRDWIKTLVIAAAAVVVIGFGSWGMFRVFGWYSPAGEARSEVADAVQLAPEEEVMEMAVEEEAVEEEPAAAEESEDFAMEMKEVENIPAGPGKVDEDFLLKLGGMGEPVEIVAGNLLFLYWVAESEQGIDLFLIIEELDPELAFTGYIEAVILDVEGQVAASRSFDLEEFKRGSRIQEFIPITITEGSLNILINGIFE
jgi:hypothetical protein